MKQATFQLRKHNISQIDKNHNINDTQNNIYIEKTLSISSIKPLKVAENVYYFNKK